MQEGSWGDGSMNSSEPNGFSAHVLLQSLPSPVLVISADDRIVAANAAAEAFFSLSQSLLQRMGLEDIVPFASPLYTAAARLRATGTTLSEYGVKLGTPRTGGAFW